MKFMKFNLAACAALALFASTSFAQTYTVKIGGGYVDPHATSTDLQGTAYGVPASLYTLSPGATLEVQPKSTVLFSVARSFGDHWEAEVLLGVPPKHDVKLRVSSALKGEVALGGVKGAVAANLASYDGQVMSTVETIAPTFFLNYRFLEATSHWRPYVGAGLNYTKFKAKVTAKGSEFYHGDSVDIELTDSYGLALQAGINYKLDQHWSLNAGLSSTMIKNDLTITSRNASGTVTSRQTAKYDFQPTVLSLMVGYSF